MKGTKDLGMHNIIVYTMDPCVVVALIKDKMEEKGLNKKVMTTCIKANTGFCDSREGYNSFLLIQIVPKHNLEQWKDYGEIIAALKELKLGLDVRVDKLSKFISKREMS
jgi:hypothetical protein